MSLPAISIITIVRNGAKFIERCLQSVATQDYPNLQYIVLDGASTDGTQAIIERFRNSLSYYHSRPDKGPYDATLQGFALAKGDIIGLQMADDWLAPGAMHALAELYASQPEARLFCFGMQEHEGQGLRRRYIPPRNGHFRLEDGLYCHGMTQYYRRDLLQEQGFFNNARYPQMADRDFYMRLGLAGTRKASTDAVLYHFLVHPASNSMSGNTEKTCEMLAETLLLADDWLAKPGLAHEHRRLLADWYCFNAWRLAWFQLKAQKPWKMLITLSRALRYPVSMLRKLACWRMPKAYQGISA